MIKETEMATSGVVNFIVMMIIVIELYICEMRYLTCQSSKKNDGGQH
jgi:hypothetical protein